MPQTFIKVAGSGFCTPFAAPRLAPPEKPPAPQTAPFSTHTISAQPSNNSSPQHHCARRDQADERKRELLQIALTGQRAEVLHAYNEIKDVAQTVLGVIATRRSCSLVQVYDTLGIDFSD